MCFMFVILVLGGFGLNNKISTQIVYDSLTFSFSKSACPL